MEYIEAKQLLVRTGSPEWFDTDYNMNIYRGCSHGCLYCDSRSNCYQIENFDTIQVKENVPFLLEQELRSKRNKGIISMGAMSDPYNPLEKELKLTRKSIELIGKYHFGLGLATKSALVARDIDVIREVSEQAPVVIKLTITTTDDRLGSYIEPRVSLSSERFKALEALSDAGIFTGVLAMPILPYIGDSQKAIKNLVNASKNAGASFIYFGGLTTRSGQREYLIDGLRELEERGKIETGITDTYISEYKNSYYCSSPQGKELYLYIKEQCEENNILYKMKDIIKAYKKGYGYEQLTLF